VFLSALAARFDGEIRKNLVDILFAAAGTFDFRSVEIRDLHRYGKSFPAGAAPEFVGWHG